MCLPAATGALASTRGLSAQHTAECVCTSRVQEDMRLGVGSQSRASFLRPVSPAPPQSPALSYLLLSGKSLLTQAVLCPVCSPVDTSAEVTGVGDELGSGWGAFGKSQLSSQVRPCPSRKSGRLPAPPSLCVSSCKVLVEQMSESGMVRYRARLLSWPARRADG